MLWRMKSLLDICLLAALLPSGTNQLYAQACDSTAKSTIAPDWDPLTMTGEYRVQWISTSGQHRESARLRLFLWKASRRDSSPNEHKRPAVGDTVTHPLYGVMVRDSGNFTPARIELLHSGVDPIYPPVLLDAPISKTTGQRMRNWIALLLHTVGNRRDDVMGEDGGGTGMIVKQIDADGFKGTFEPWGIVVGDKGYYCARRVRN
jgi:hypothetical protein